MVFFLIIQPDHQYRALKTQSSRSPKPILIDYKVLGRTRQRAIKIGFMCGAA